MKVTPIFLLMAIVAFWPSGSAPAQADTPKAERPVRRPPGSTLTVKLNLSGSLGSGMPQVTVESLGEVDWDGKRVMGFQIGKPGNYSYVDAQGHALATVRDGKLFQTFDPPEPLYDWPLFCGEVMV